MSTSPIIDAFFDESTFTITYLVSDPVQRRAAIIDPVLDYDHRSGTISTHSADRVLAKAAERDVQIDLVLETHAHADHLTAAPHLKTKTGREGGYRGAHQGGAKDLQAGFCGRGRKWGGARIRSSSRRRGAPAAR